MSSILARLPSVTVYRTRLDGLSVELSAGASAEKALHELAMELERVKAQLTDEIARCCDAQMALEHFRGLGIDLSEGA